MLLVPVRRARAAARISPVLATALLTAAIFLLPATGDRQPARAFVDNVKVSATHPAHDTGTKGPASRE